MGIVAIIVIIVILACFSSLPDENSCSSHTWGQFNEEPYSKPRDSYGNSECFEEDASYYDRDGNEHLVDEDMYCEDCDDYHDFD